MGSGILVGDLLQLTVGQDSVYHSDLWYKFQRVDLCENIRAKGDLIHIDHLEKWRNGIINDDDLHFLKEREICPNGLEKNTVAEKFIDIQFEVQGCAIRKSGIKQYMLCGATNSNASMIGGTTIYKAFRYPIDLWGADSIQYRHNPDLKLVIIDEISMIHP